MGRRRPWGSVRRLASRRYQARLPDGSAAPDTFPTKAEASRWLSLAEADLLRGTFVHPSLNANITVAEWLEEWRAPGQPKLAGDGAVPRRHQAAPGVDPHHREVRRPGSSAANVAAA
jgi:hypothetical protein